MNLIYILLAFNHYQWARHSAVSNHMYVAREMHMQEDVDTVYIKQKKQI